MLSVSTNIPNYVIQTPVVNTVTPGTTTVHVPYDNVAPSVSSPQIGDNASGNSVYTKDEQPEEAASQVSEDTTSQHNGSNLSTTAQSTFLAQLAAQDLSPESEVYLVQYEKLVAASSVKYKPSNTLKPLDGPASIFGRILEENHASEHTSAHTTLHDVTHTGAEHGSAQPSQQEAIDAVERAEQAPRKKTPANDNAVAEHTPKEIVVAYADSATRISIQNIDPVQEVV